MGRIHTLLWLFLRYSGISAMHICSLNIANLSPLKSTPILYPIKLVPEWDNTQENHRESEGSFYIFLEDKMLNTGDLGGYKGYLWGYKGCL